jgi:hypothetical protein
MNIEQETQNEDKQNIEQETQHEDKQNIAQETQNEDKQNNKVKPNMKSSIPAA